MDNNKRYGMLGLALNGILSVFDCYGMGTFIPQVKGAIIEVVKALDEDRPPKVVWDDFTSQKDRNL